MNLFISLSNGNEHHDLTVIITSFPICLLNGFCSIVHLPLFCLRSSSRTFLPPTFSLVSDESKLTFVIYKSRFFVVVVFRNIWHQLMDLYNKITDNNRTFCVTYIVKTYYWCWTSTQTSPKNTLSRIEQFFISIGHRMFHWIFQIELFVLKWISYPIVLISIEFLCL